MQFTRGINQPTIFLVSSETLLVSYQLHKKWNRRRFAILGASSHLQIVGKISNQICYWSFNFELNKTKSFPNLHRWLNIVLAFEEKWQFATNFYNQKMLFEIKNKLKMTFFSFKNWLQIVIFSSSIEWKCNK